MRFYGAPTPSLPALGFCGWARALTRTAAILFCIFTLMLPVIFLRALGFHHAAARLVQLAARICLRIIGLTVRVHGQPAQWQSGTASIIANHISWLDIFVLNAQAPLRFIAKAELKGEFPLGLIARSTGTIFIRRHWREALNQKHLLRRHLKGTQTLVLFPEGTSTDGHCMLPFKSSLFAAFIEESSARSKDKPLSLQPLALQYIAPSESPNLAYGWWGDLGFFEHLFFVLSHKKQGQVAISFTPPIRVSDYTCRKSLCRDSQAAIQNALPHLTRAPADSCETLP